MADILVTGATGFVGTHLTAALSSSWAVHGLDRASGDIAEPQTWDHLPKCDVVIHLAGKSFVPASWEKPAEFMRVNLGGTMQALEYCRRTGARLIFASSYLYGNPASLPIPETAALHALNPYAQSKMMAEQACRFYADNFGVQILVIRPFNVYGPGQSPDFLVSSVVRQVLERDEVRVKDLLPRRDYVYVADVVAAMIAALRARWTYEVINIGSGTSHSVSEIIEAVMTGAGKSLPVHSDNISRQNEVMDVRADISRASQVMGWSPSWTLEQGCAAMLAAWKA